jgi:hypothetical protein
MKVVLILASYAHEKYTGHAYSGSITHVAQRINQLWFCS